MSREDAITSRWDLARVLQPVTPEAFFAETYERRHLAIHREDRDWFSDLMSADDIDRAVSDLGLRAENLNLVKTGEGIEKASYTFETGELDPVRVFQHFGEGATVVLPHLHRVLPRLADYCRALETAFSADLQTNIYMTPAGSQGFKTHYDSHDVLVLQIAGSKEWRIYDGGPELPTRDMAFTPEGFEPGPEIDRLVLHPGDTLYVPRGVVHDARSTGETSLHITTGILPVRWIDLIAEAVAARALVDPELRRSLPPGYGGPDADMGAMAAELARLIGRAAGGVDAEAALAERARAYRASRRPRVRGQLHEIEARHSVAEGRRAEARGDLIYRIVPDAEGKLRLETGGTEIVLPAHVEETLRRALTVGPFTVGELPGPLDAEGQVVLVRRLLREGLVRLLP